MRKSILTMGMAAVALAFAFPASADWKPNKPIRIIVPWGAGGSTDQVTRVCAGDLEDALGQKIVVVNQPGGSGAVGTKSTLDAPRDGYTWTAGAVKDLATYAVTGKLDTKLQDWHLYLNQALVTVVSVHPDSPYKDFGDYLKALKAGKVTVATAGVNSSGHSAIESVVQAAGGSYKHLTYDGGNPAVIATVGGEAQSTTQLITEQVEMIRAKKLRPLAVLSTDAAKIPGVDSIPPITNWIKDFKAAPIYFGIFVPKGVPADVVATLNKVWDSKMASSKALADYAVKKGSVVTVHSGEAAFKRAWPTIQINAWMLQAAGKTKVSPDTVGIPKP